MISDFLLIASICGFTLGLTACGIFLFSNRTQAFANRMLALTLFCLATIMVVTFLLEWNIEYYALIYRFPSPLYYLALPAAYLYLRSVIRKESSFRKTDWIHFLPAILHFAEMLPFYFTSYEYRRELTRQLQVEPEKLLELNEGLLPPNYHTAIRFVQGCFYIFLMARILWEARRKKDGEMGVPNKQTYNWLVTFTGLIGILAIPVIAYLFFPNTSFVKGTAILFVVISVSFIIINLYLFSRPQILYGIPATALPGTNDNTVLEPLENKIKETTTEGTEIPQPAGVNLEYYKPILEQYIAKEKPFLKQSYSISDLSSETGIPQHHLSALLNRIYEMRFTDFLNRMRINYIRENFNKEGWHQLTLEGIAKIAGFNSRTTFFNAIKKATGLTPSEFMLEVKANQILKDGSSVNSEKKEEV